MRPESEWTWVYYKVLGSSGDCFSLPELLQESIFIGFPGGDTRVPATSREETEAAVLDLLAAGAIDLFDNHQRLSLEAALAVLRTNSAWQYPRAEEIQVVENNATPAFLARRPESLNPHRPIE